MNVLLFIGLLPLAGTAYHDFRYRAIAWFWPPLLFLLFFFGALQSETLTEVLFSTGLNLLFVILNLSLISIYFSFKNRAWVNITRSHLGWGDILFFIAFTPAFSTVNFVLFFVLSIMLITFIQLIGFLFRRSFPATIPLAGWMAILLMGPVLLELIAGPGMLYADDWILF